MHRSLLVGAAALFLSAGVAQAQSAKPQTRQGFNISFGLGGGSGQLTTDQGSNSDRKTGGTMYLNIGGTVMPNLTLGGEINGWTHSENNQTGTFATMMAVAHYYPMLTNGWYVTGGLGVASAQAKDDNTGDKLESNGLGLEIGTGYDWRLGTNFSLSPYFQYVYGTKGTAKLNGQDAGMKMGGNFFQLGLGFTWH